MSRYITRKQFEDFTEMTDGNVYQSPSYNSSKIRMCFDYKNEDEKIDVELTLVATAIKQEIDGKFYGRREDWDLVKLSTWGCDNFQSKGKGSRNTKLWKMFDEFTTILIGEVEEKETKVTLV